MTGGPASRLAGARARSPRGAGSGLGFQLRVRLLHVGLAIVALIGLAALLAPLLARHDPVSNSLGVALRPPAWKAEGTLEYPLGTDQFGRDILARLVYGARISLFVSTGAAAVGGAFGVALGLVAGYYGGLVDAAIMRFVDLNLAFPLILLALAVVAILGPSLRNLVVVMAITTWMIYARTVRAAVLALRQREFVVAARVIGVGEPGIILRHLLPNVMATVLVLFTLEVARVILMESALSFLGLGVPPPTPTWGRMLAEGREYLTVSPWIVAAPGLAIMLTVLGVNFLGDGLRDAWDPRLRGSA